MHPSTQAEYFAWIKTCIETPSAIGPFCDWLDEVGIRSQQWREVWAMMPKVKYIKQVLNKNLWWCSMVTAHKTIDLRFIDKNRIFVNIRKRPQRLTNKVLERPQHLISSYDYKKVG